MYSIQYIHIIHCFSLEESRQFRRVILIWWKLSCVFYCYCTNVINQCCTWQTPIKTDAYAFSPSAWGAEEQIKLRSAFVCVSFSLLCALFQVLKTFLMLPSAMTICDWWFPWAFVICFCVITLSQTKPSMISSTTHFFWDQKPNQKIIWDITTYRLA